MIRRVLVIVGVVGVMLIAAISLVNYFRSFKDVTFEVSNPNNDVYSLKVYDLVGHDIVVSQYDKEQPKHTLSTNGTVRLRNGEYLAILSGEGIETTTTELTVKEDTAFKLGIKYTSEKLTTLLRKEFPNIRQAIYERYPQLNPKKNAWSFIDEKLHNQGQWYSATFQPRGNQLSDVYRIVLEKNNGQWVVATRAYILLTSHEYPNIPREVLVDVNTRQKPQLRER